MPTRMRDRWDRRTETSLDHGTVYWHVLMRDQCGVVSAAKEVRARLAGFSGFHRPPDAWLHMTALEAGSTVDFTREQMFLMMRDAQASLGSMEPIRTSVGRVLFHPEAVMLALEPRDRLLVVGEAVRAATAANAREPAVLDERTTWVPHVTVLYSTSEQDAAPIVAAAGRRVPSHDVVVDAVSLVIQWGSEKSWNWEVIGSAKLGANT